MIATSTDTVTFDAAGRPVDQITWRGTHRYVLRSSYDVQGRRTKLKEVAWADSVLYGYYQPGSQFTLPNLVGQLVSITDPGGGVTKLSYNADRLLDYVAFPTGDTLRRTVASSHRTGALAWSPAALEAAFGLSFSEDSIMRTTGVRFAASDTLRSFAYDAAGRLASYEDRTYTAGLTCTSGGGTITGTTCTSTGGYTVADSALYAYYAVGSRTDHGAVVGTGNRLTALDQRNRHSCFREVRTGRAQERRTDEEPFGRLDGERRSAVVARVARHQHIRTDVNRTGRLQSVLEIGPFPAQRLREPVVIHGDDPEEPQEQLDSLVRLGAPPMLLDEVEDRRKGVPGYEAFRPLLLYAGQRLRRRIHVRGPRLDDVQENVHIEQRPDHLPYFSSRCRRYSSRPPLGRPRPRSRDTRGGSPPSRRGLSVEILRR